MRDYTMRVTLLTDSGIDTQSLSVFMEMYSIRTGLDREEILLELLKASVYKDMNPDEEWVAEEACILFKANGKKIIVVPDYLCGIPYTEIEKTLIE